MTQTPSSLHFHSMITLSAFILNPGASCCEPAAKPIVSVGRSRHVTSEDAARRLTRTLQVVGASSNGPPSGGSNCVSVQVSPAPKVLVSGNQGTISLVVYVEPCWAGTLGAPRPRFPSILQIIHRGGHVCVPTDPPRINVLNGDPYGAAVACCRRVNNPDDRVSS